MSHMIHVPDRLTPNDGTGQVAEIVPTQITLSGICMAWRDPSAKASADGSAYSIASEHQAAKLTIGCP